MTALFAYLVLVVFFTVGAYKAGYISGATKYMDYNEDDDESSEETEW